MRYAFGLFCFTPTGLGGGSALTVRGRRDVSFLSPSTDVQSRLSRMVSERAPEVRKLMGTSETSTITGRVTSTWRELGRMQTYQVPMVLGGAIAVLAGFVTYVVRALSEGSAAAVPLGAVYLVVFGALAIVGYAISRASVKNGAVVAGIAGLALLLLAGGAAGLLTGLLVIVAAVWGIAKA